MGDRMQDLQSREATKLGAPWLWDSYPFIRVERRSKQRPQQPLCVVHADDTGWVRPSVFLVKAIPPQDFDPETNPGFHYVDLEALAADGWRIAPA